MNRQLWKSTHFKVILLVAAGVVIGVLTVKGIYSVGPVASSENVPVGTKLDAKKTSDTSQDATSSPNDQQLSQGQGHGAGANDNTTVPSDYPAAYKQANLPEYPGAKLTSLSTDSSGKIELDLTYNVDVDKVMSWYDQQLTSSGWTNDSKIHPQPFLYNTKYEKNNQFFILNLKQPTGSTTTTGHINFPFDQGSN